MANPITPTGEGYRTKSQRGRLREVQILEQIRPMGFFEMDKALKLNLEDGAINFERSNQIAQKYRSY